ncbi:MAG: glycosyltransferase family 2 protein [Magnetococcales bacterium]|nr:glycosyltransferase family 2 protein [Magnetococcales bacterium]
MPEVSIIIRTRNEERWIRHCLRGVFEQDYSDFEVILVDNASSDHTVAVAKRFPVAKVISIDKFIPGKAINDGIRASSGRYIVCLSAHCVPASKTWLSFLLQNFADEKVAGVYGRQLPVAFSTALDKRDLTIVFGLDRRVQIKDYFFHNANSMIKRSVWDKIPFDEQVTNIEDRVWGKAVIEDGYHLVYEPDAPVYHHHGLHQSNDEKRAKGVVSIIEKMDEQSASRLPESIQPGNYDVVAVLPIRGSVQKPAGRDILGRLLDLLQKSRYLGGVYLFADDPNVEKIAKKRGLSLIHRPQEFNAATKSIEDVLQYCLTQIEAAGDYPESILNLDYLYPFRPVELIDELIHDAQFNGLDTIFPGYVEYRNMWKKDHNGSFIHVGESLLPRERKTPMYQALYGLGCLTAVPVIRSGRLVGDTVGILPITDRKQALRYKGNSSSQIVELLLKAESL